MTAKEIEQIKLNRRLYHALEHADIALVEALLDNGADPSSTYDDETFYKSDPDSGTSLYFVQNLDIHEEIKLTICKLLLKYRGYALIDFPEINDYSPLMPAVKNENYEMVKLLLSYGINNVTFGEDFGDDTPYELVEDGKYFHNHPYRNELLTLLNDDITPPYLMIENERYIIHELDEELDIDVLGVLAQSHTKKYLYSGINMALIIYWVITRNFFVIDIAEKIKTLTEKITLDSKDGLIELIKGVVTDNNIKIELLKEEFSDSNFLQDYLSTTLWKYNFHDDLKLLFKVENGFAVFSHTQKTYEYILKLIDLRYQQHVSEWIFSLNANQNKEELEALIEEIEVSKRVEDLSFLEEKTEKEVLDNNNIIPDDFMKS